MIIGNLSPITYYNHSEFLEKEKISMDYNMEWKEYQYVLFDYNYIYDDRYTYVGGEPAVYEYLFLFHVFRITLKDTERPMSMTRTMFKDIADPPSSIAFAYVFLFSAYVTILIFLYYFQSFFRNFRRFLTKDSLYCGILGSIIIIAITVSSFMVINFTDKVGRGRIFYIKFGYGFYYYLIAISLFFVMYLIQKKYIYYSNKKED